MENFWKSWGSLIILIVNVIFLAGFYFAKLKDFVTKAEVRTMLDGETKKILDKNDKKFDEVTRDIKDAEEEIKNIRGNYLDRFDEIKTIIGEKHEETLVALGEISKTVGEQTAYCKAVQDMKKNSK